MLINFIENILLFQYLIGSLVWIFSFFLIVSYLNKCTNLSLNKKFFFLFYYILLSITAIIRIFADFLPVTPDSIEYINAADNIARGGDLNLFGAFFYSDIIFLIKSFTFNNHYSIVFINIFIFIIALIELLHFHSSNNLRNFWLWGLFLLVYPSVYWFIPNVLRESIFFFCLVNIYTRSLQIFEQKQKYKNSLLLIIYLTLSVLLRPQILPIIILWLIYLFFRKNFFIGLISLVVGLTLSLNEFIISEYVSKVSLEYLQAKKTEGASSVPTIAFKEIIIPKTVYELISYTPFLIFRFLFSPFPWELSNLRYFFAFFDALVMVLLFFTITFKILFMRIWKPNILVFSFLFITVLGIFEIAFTGAVRHRMPYVLILSTFLMFEHKKDVLFSEN